MLVNFYIYITYISIKIKCVRYCSRILFFLIHKFEICRLLHRVLQKFYKSFTKVQEVVFENKTFYSAHCASFAELRCFAAYPTIDVTWLPESQKPWWAQANSQITNIRNNDWFKTWKTSLGTTNILSGLHLKLLAYYSLRNIRYKQGQNVSCYQGLFSCFKSLLMIWNLVHYVSGTCHLWFE